MNWKYHIKSYRRDALGSFEAALEAKADTWFLFGDQGEDRRVFGVFSTRRGAEDCADKLTRGVMGEQYRGILVGSQDYKEMLKERAEDGRLRQDRDTGIDR
jgi:hypothetical protein